MAAADATADAGAREDGPSGGRAQQAAAAAVAAADATADAGARQDGPSGGRPQQAHGSECLASPCRRQHHSLQR